MFLSDAKKNAPVGRSFFSDYRSLLVASLFLSGWLSTSHFTPWVSWHSEVPFFIGAFGVALALSIRALRKKDSPGHSIPLTIWPLGLLMVITCFQVLTGEIEFFGNAFVVVLYLCLGVICIAIGAELSPPKDVNLPASSCVEFGEWLAWLTLIGIIASVSVAMAQVLQVWEDSAWIVRMPYIRRPGGNLGQPNHLATLIVMGMASAIYLMSLKRIGGLGLSAVLVFCGLGIAITESRTGVLSLFGLVIWWLWKQPVISSTISRWFALPFVVFFLAVYLLWPWAFSAFSGDVRATGPLRLEADVIDARLAFWPQLIEAILQRPWLGWGMRETAQAHSSVVHGYGYSLPLTYSHNLILDLALWIGLPLTIFICIAVLYWLWKRTKAIGAPSPWFGMAMALPLGVHSMLEFPFAYAYLLVPAMLGVGLMEGSLRAVKTVSIKSRHAFGVMVFISALSALSAIEFVRIEQSFRDVRFEMLRIGEKSIARNDSPVLLLTQLHALVLAARLELRPGMGVEEMLLLKRVAEHYAWSGPQFRYVTALALNNQSNEATRLLKVIRAQHGNAVHDSLRNQMNQTLLKNEVKGDAYEAYKPILGN